MVASVILLTTALVILPALVLAESPIDQPIDYEENDQDRRYTSTSGQDVIKRLLIDYDQARPPYSEGTTGNATEIKLGFYFLTLKFQDKTDFEATLYLRQSWNDGRLKFDHLPAMKNERINVMNEEMERIWKPDTFFRRVADVREHAHPSRNILFKVSSGGGVWYVRKLTVRSTCETQTTRYPIDKRTCKIFVESFGYTTRDLVLSGLDKPLELDSAIAFGGWHLTGTDVEDCSQSYTTGITGSYPCLKFSMNFVRNTGYYIFKTYAPSFLLVLLSWLPLWIGAQHQMIARLVPGIAAQLGLIILGNGAYDKLPEVSHITPMHVWMGFSHILVLLSIVKVIAFQGQGLNIEAGSGTSGDGETMTKSGAKFGERFQQNSSRMDLISRVAFPGIYILFNIIYWIAYKA